MPLSLKQKAFKGVTWNLIEQFGVQIIRLSIGVLLARLLIPADFGLIAMITVFFAVAEVFVNSGFAQAYIQKKEVTDLDANTVFYTNLLISILTYIVLWISAPAIARFYEQPALIDLTRVMGLIVILNAFNVIQNAQLVRAVDFKRKTKLILTASLISGILGVLAAYTGLSVWSLVIQQIAMRVIVTAGLWLTSRWKPSLQFSIESFRSLFSFGAWVLAANIVMRIFDNIYTLVIGKLFLAAQLGFYSKAKQFEELPANGLTMAVGAVAFPVLSQYQEDRLQLKNKARKFLIYTMAFTAPLLGILLVVAKPMVLLLLTGKWSPMIPYLQVLCISGILYPIHAFNVQVLQAQGKSRLNFRLALIKNSLRIINIAVMHRWGLIFMIIGEVICSFLSLAINTYFTKRFLDYGIVEQFNDLKPTFLAVVLAGLLGYTSSFAITNMYLRFFAGFCVSVIVYMSLQYLLNKIFFMEILSLAKGWAKHGVLS